MLSLCFLPRRLTTLLVCLLATISASLADTSATHTVNLTPAWKAGQEYVTALTYTINNGMVLKQGDKVVQQRSQKKTIHFEADATALSSFPHGGLRKTALVVRSLKVATDGAPATDFLPANSKIIVEGIGVDQATFTIDGKPATAEQEAVLKLVTSTDDPQHNDQIIFGTDKPVAVGGSWTPNTEALKATVGKEFGKDAIVTGTMKLDAIKGFGFAQVNVISGVIDIKNIAPPLPPGMTPKSGGFRIVLTGEIPAHRANAKRIENMTGTANFVGEFPAPDGSVLTMTVTTEIKTASVTTFP